MKSQQRHDLKSNALERIAGQIAPFFKKNGQRIVLGLCGGLVVSAIVIYWIRSSSAKSASAWRSMITASNSADPESFMNIADEKSYQGSQVASWARLLAAEGHYISGIQLYFTDRSSGVEELDLAREAFETVLKSEKATDVMRERALFGLARCKETTADGNTQAALAAYNNLLREFPDSIYKDDVEQRIIILNTEDAQEFYAWFSKQTTPKPEDRNRPRDGFFPGTGPLFPQSPDNQPFNPLGTMDDRENPFSGRDDSTDGNKTSVPEPVSALKPPVEATHPQPK